MYSVTPVHYKFKLLHGTLWEYSKYSEILDQFFGTVYLQLKEL